LLTCVPMSGRCSQRRFPPWSAHSLHALLSIYAAACRPSLGWIGPSGRRRRRPRRGRRPATGCPCRWRRVCSCLRTGGPAAKAGLVPTASVVGILFAITGYRVERIEGHYIDADPTCVLTTRSAAWTSSAAAAGLLAGWDSDIADASFACLPRCSQRSTRTSGSWANPATPSGPARPRRALSSTRPARPRSSARTSPQTSQRIHSPTSSSRTVGGQGWMNTAGLVVPTQRSDVLDLWPIDAEFERRKASVRWLFRWRRSDDRA
jgi:hypothetical protein